MPRLRKILVATDFSKEASHAVERAALLALDHGAAIRLIHAHRSLPVGALARIGIRKPVAEQVDAALRARLDADAATLRDRGIAVSARVMRGGPLTAIEQALGSFAADLVVVGAQGQRSLRNTLLGTTAQRVLEYVQRDILAVRNAPRAAYSRVVVGIDADERAASVLTTATALFPSATLQVVHAYEPLFESKLRFAGASDATVRQHQEESRRQAERKLLDAIRRSEIGIPRRSVILRRGYPPQVILDVAQRRKAELVVLGRAQTPVSEVFLGSVSKRVLQETRCDVAIVGRNPT